MSNIVPQTNEEGQLGREGRRWASVHAKLASLDQVTFAGTADASPGPRSLWVNAEGVLHFGDSALALGGDVGQITALTELFFGNNAAGGVQSQLDFINENFDTLVEVANGLTTLTSEVTTLGIKLGDLDTVVVNHTVDIDTQSGLIATLTASLTTLTENFNNRLSPELQEGAVVTLVGSTLGPSALSISGDVISADGKRLGNEESPFKSLTLNTAGVVPAERTTLSTDAGGRLLANGQNIPHISVAYSSNLSELSALTDDDELSPSGLVLVRDQNNVPSEILPREGVGGPIPLNLGSGGSPFNKIFCVDLIASNNSVFVGDVKLSSVGATLSVGTLSGTAQPVVLQPQLTSAIEAEVVARDAAISAAVSPLAASLTSVSNVVATLEAASESLTMNGLLDTDLTGVASGDILQYNGSDWVPSDVRVDTTAGTAYVVSGNVAINYQSAADSIAKQTTTTWIDEVVITNQFWAPNADGNNDYFVLDMSALNKSDVTLIPTPSSLDNFALDTTPESVVDFLGLTADVYYFWSENGKTWLYNTTGFPATANELALSPRTDLGVSLGSPNKRFKDLYLSGNSIVIGDATISASGSTLSTNGAAIALASELNSAVSTLTASINSEATARLAGDNALASSLSDVQTTLEDQINALESSVSSSLSSLNTSLTASIDAEVTRATDAETALATSLSNLGATLSVSIQAETTRATAAETTLSGQLTSLGMYAAATNGSLADEVTRATSAEAVLQAQITANSVSINAVVSDVTLNATSISTVAANLASEVTRATGAESALASSLSALSGRVADIISNSDPAALDSLTEIVTAFQSADSNLNSAITTLAADRESALSAHISANAASFSALSASIAAEVTRATNAESALQTQITANSVSVGAVASDLADEVTRATDAEAVLAASINALQLSAATLSSDLAAEVTRATGAEATLAASIAQNTSDIVQTNIVLSDLQTTVSQLDTGGEATSAAISALETELNSVEQSAFGNDTAVYPRETSANYISTASNLHNATVLLDTALKAEETARINGLASKQDALTLVSPMTFNGATLSIVDGSFATPAEVSAVASSLSALTDRVGDLEGAPAISVDPTGSSALSYDTESGTLALVDASINAGTAASLASSVDLALTGAVTGSASFSSGGTVTLTTAFAEDMATQAELNNALLIANGLTGAVSNRVDAIEADYLTSSSTLSSSNLDNASVSVAGLSVDLGGSISASSLSDVLNLSDFVTASSLTSAGFATTSYVDNAVNGLASAADVTDAIGAAVSGLASETYVDTQVSNLVSAAPGTLNTLNELAAALGDDPNFATSVTAHLGTLSSRITSLDSAKQDVLTAGGGISFNGATISTSFDIGDYVTAASHNAAIATLSSSVSDLQDADSAHDTLIASITLSIGTLTTDLATEASTARAAESANASAISALSLSLGTAITNEASARSDADDALSASISAVSLSLHGELDALSTTVTGHTSTLASHASTLTSLASLISVEESARISADDALGARVDGVVADLAAATLSLSASITSLQDADTAFASSLSTLESSISSVSLALAGEVSRATSAESVLASSITSLASDLSDEVTARTGADNTLQSNIDAEATARASADTALQANIAAETTRATNAEQVNADAIAAETLARTTADTTLQSNLDAEVSRAKAAEQVNASAISAEVARATAAETELQDSIDAEASARVAAVVTLQSNIDAEASARTAADTTLQDNIDAESSARASADTTLQDNIDTLTASLASEVTRATSAEQANAAAISAETTARQSADNTLQDNIDAEAGTREAADVALQVNITSEATVRASADTALQGNIDAEASARQAADTTLQGNIDAEATARQSADTALQANIDTEASRAAAAELANAAAISTEVSRAQAAESTLQASIDTEAVARVSADNALEASIDANKFTDDKARNAISVTGDLGYDSGSGVISYVADWQVTANVLAADNKIRVVGHVVEMFDMGADMLNSPSMTLDAGSLTGVTLREVDMGTLDQERLF